MKLRIFAVLLILIPISMSSQVIDDITLLLPGKIITNNTSDSLFVLKNKPYTKIVIAATKYLYCKKRDSLQVIQIATQTEINRICDSALVVSRKESKIWYDSLIFYDNKLKTTEIDLVKAKKCKRTLFITSAISTLAAITFAILFIIK